jgi:hypothetical protein
MMIRALVAAALLSLSSIASAGSLNLKLRNAEGQEVLNKILDDTSFWSGAYIKAYEGKEYDEIRLKELPTGYVPMITGEGLQSFDHDVVADIVFEQNTRLPKYMDGAKIVMDLGKGYDDVVGAEYRDTFYVLDLTAFYGTFPQRMYRKHDPATNTTVLWFEKIDPTWVSPATWTAYQAQMKKAVDGMDKGWVFNSVVDVGQVYGMFVVEPGKTQTSRVSFVSKLTFGDDAGWVAKFGSQLPGVLKAGLRSGFAASVAIAGHEQARRGPAASPGGGGTSAEPSAQP